MTVAAAALAGASWGAEDSAGRALQQHQLQRQQQQDALQLRMQQQQSGSQRVSPAARRPASDLPEIDEQQRQRQAMDRLHIDQRQRQQLLHDRQDVEPGTAQAFEDEAGRRTKAQMELHKARQSSEQQLRRFESELQSEAPAGTGPAWTGN